MLTVVDIKWQSDYPGCMERTSLNISLPKVLKEYVETQVAGGTYSTPSEFLRELIREDRKRRSQETLESALMEGLKSGPPVEMNMDAWDRKRRRLRGRHKPAKTTG
jgi:antitoxin ParD1/3/4